MKIQNVRRAAVVGLALAVAVGVSGSLYQGTRAADFESHARTTEAIERERHLMTLLKQGVLASRFGLLSQYDPLTSTVEEANTIRTKLRADTNDLAATMPSLTAALDGLDASTERRRQRVERFKSEGAILKNSLYYLPAAGASLRTQLETAGADHSLGQAIHAVVESTLTNNLLGTKGKKTDLLEKRNALAALRDRVPPALSGRFDLLLAHAAKVDETSASVDPLVEQILDNDVEESLAVVEREYSAAFQARVDRAADYRAALYAWSLLLTIAVLLTVGTLLRSYDRLESRVLSRTAELRKAVSELWGEMELAKKIQRALLPAKPQLAGCEVAASMQSADEVGGDYYDVIDARGTQWVLMGDVSGHGVPAGLVMMMCQTAVRTTLERDPHILPSDLLAAVNRALSVNIRLLGETKYMTLQALRRDGEGRFLVSGLHQDLFVYRANTGTVSEIRTRGMWLGVVDEIKPMLEDEEVTLAEGDSLLLFTDGVTEATRGDAMLDNHGLVHLFRELGAQSPEAVIAGITARLSSYTVGDDASLLVIRRCAGSDLLAGP